MEKTWQRFVQLKKFDEETGIGEGVLALEVADKSGEIFDYDTSKEHFKNWSSEIEKASNGKSVGNLREMHEGKAVGKFLSIDFDDETKSIPVRFKVVDRDAREKCAEGVYTGLSIGGTYVKSWKDDSNPKLTRYTAKPFEGSVVDNPCMPGATFTYKRADGAEELRKFTTVRSAEQVWKCESGCTHATKRDALGCDGTITKNAPATLLEKCLDCAASVAYLIQRATTDSPEIVYSDGYVIAGHTEMEAGVKQLFDALRAMVNDLRDEWMTEEGVPEDPTLAMSALADNLKKSHELIKRLRVPIGNGSIHQPPIEKVAPQGDDPMSEAKEAAKPAAGEELNKSVGDLTKNVSDLSKAVGDLTSFIKSRDEAVASDIANLNKAVRMLAGLPEDGDEDVAKAVGNQPAAPQGVARPIAKSEDADGAVKIDPKDDPIGLRKAFASGGIPFHQVRAGIVPSL